MTLRAGAATVTVDVPVGTPMAGFAGRLGPSTGVHDATTVRALVLDDVGLVAVDVCVLHEDTCRAIERASDLAGVVVAATHTHGGPSVGAGRVGPHDDGVHRAIVDAAGRALRTARERQVAVDVSWASATGTGVARDRRHLDRAIDPAITGLLFRDRAGDVVAVLAGYPCHPVVLDGSNTLVTGDYVDPLRTTLERRFQAPCLFLTGAAGDVNDGHAATASFGSGSAPGRTFARANELGGRLGDALADAPFSPLRPDGGARLLTAAVTLPFQHLPAAGVAAARETWLEERAGADPGTRAVLDVWIDWAGRWRPGQDAPWQGRVGRLDLGGAFSILTLPGEPFLAVADTLEGAAHVPVLVAGYCDGVPGYLPTADAYPEGGYEVEDAHRYYGMPAPFAAGGAERVILAARGLLEG